MENIDMALDDIKLEKNPARRMSN